MQDNILVVCNAERLLHRGKRLAEVVQDFVLQRVVAHGVLLQVEVERARLGRRNLFQNRCAVVSLERHAQHRRLVFVVRLPLAAVLHLLHIAQEQRLSLDAAVHRKVIRLRVAFRQCDLSLGVVVRLQDRQYGRADRDVASSRRRNVDDMVRRSANRLCGYRNLDPLRSIGT